MQIGLVLKPGPQEPWTPYRMGEAFVQAGFPSEAFSIYPGGGDVGAAVLQGCERAMIFGGTATVKQYNGNPRVQPHGPGFSKILLGDDMVDKWENYLDIMVDSVLVNSGRGCISCSGIWARATAARSPRPWPSGWARSPRCRRTIPSRPWRHSRARSGRRDQRPDRSRPSSSRARRKSPRNTAAARGW